MLQTTLNKRGLFFHHSEVFVKEISYTSGQDSFLFLIFNYIMTDSNKYCLSIFTFNGNIE